MKAYLLSLLGAAFLAAAVGVLAPDGNAGAGRHLRLLSVLVLLCVVVAPLPRLVTDLRDLPDLLPDRIDRESTEPGATSESPLDAASRAYVARSLTARVCERFSIPSDEVRCAIRWGEGDNAGTPLSATLILSGSARWKDPREIAAYVTDLLGCPCETAIA